MASQKGREALLHEAARLDDETVAGAGRAAGERVGDTEERVEKAGQVLKLRLLAERLAAEEKALPQVLLCPQCGRPTRRPKAASPPDAAPAPRRRPSLSWSSRPTAGGSRLASPPPTRSGKRTSSASSTTPSPAPNGPGPSPRTRSRVATMESWEKLGDHLSARADRRGYAHAQQTVFVSDGAWDALWKRSPLASMA